MKSYYFILFLFLFLSCKKKLSTEANCSIQFRENQLLSWVAYRLLDDIELEAVETDTPTEEQYKLYLLSDKICVLDELRFYGMISKQFLSVGNWYQDENCAIIVNLNGKKHVIKEQTPNEFTINSLSV